MEAEEIELRAKAIRRKLWYQEKAPFGWTEALRQIRGVLIDPVWEEGELEDLCQDWFDQSEDFMRLLVGLEASYQQKKDTEHLPVEVPKQSIAEQLIDKKRAKALTSAEKQRAYRERKRGGR